MMQVMQMTGYSGQDTFSKADLVHFLAKQDIIHRVNIGITQTKIGGAKSINNNLNRNLYLVAKRSCKTFSSSYPLTE